MSVIKLDDGSKAKAVEREACASIYDETDDGLVAVDDAEELDSGRSAVMQESFG